VNKHAQVCNIDRKAQVMTATPQPPPEARLIRERRLALIPPLSARQAAKRAGFSPALWAKIEHGYDQVAKGIAIPYAGTADKIARAARVVGMTAAELEGCGRADAARALAALPEAPARMTPDVRAAELRATLAHLNELLDAREDPEDKGDGLSDIGRAAG
jgi:Helix-turn-helix domain